MKREMDSAAIIRQGKRQRNIAFALMLVLLLALVCVFLFPYYISLASAFKTKAELSKSVFAPPTVYRLDNFKNAIAKTDFTRSLINTCITTFPSVALLVVMSSMGGYAIARFGKIRKPIGWLDKLYLGALMIPFQILMIPVYKLYKNLGIANTLIGELIMLTGNSMAYATFLYVGFVKGVPRELEEAALVDGCGSFKAYFRIVFPLLAPITATVTALHIMWHWNDFNIAIILLQKDAVRTLTVKQYYLFGTKYNPDYPTSFACAILSMIPVVAFFMVMQKYIVSGIAAGAVKG